MTSKERISAALRGQTVDRVPWCPFLAYVWEHYPQEIRDAGQYSFLKAALADPLYRGSHTLFGDIMEDVEFSQEGNIITYKTKIGSIQGEYARSDIGNTSFLIGHPVKTKEDLKVLTYMYQNARCIPFYDGFIESSKAEEDAYYMPMIGGQGKTAFQRLIEHWMGTEATIYMLEDYPECVEEALEAMVHFSVETAKISAKCPGTEAHIFWEDTSTMNYSPAMFKKYAFPEIKQWADILHAENKLLIHHRSEERRVGKECRSRWSPHH